MNEMLKYEGRLGKAERELGTLGLIIKGLIKSIRDILDPFEEIEELSADVAAQQAVELAEKQIRYKELISDIAALKKALGR